MYGIKTSLTTIKNVVRRIEASSVDKLLLGFQTLPAVLEFLRDDLGAYTAFETEPPDSYGRRRFLRAFVSLKESRVREFRRGVVRWLI